MRLRLREQPEPLTPTTTTREGKGSEQQPSYRGHVMSRTTVCRSNGPIHATSITLGDFIAVHKYASGWHGQSVSVEARFRNGVVDFDEATLVAFIRQAQTVLATPPHDPDISGSCCDIGDPA